MQSVTPGSVAGSPLVVRLVDENDQPVPGATLTVTPWSTTITVKETGASSDFSEQSTITSDASGEGSIDIKN